jgi:hypothetical protein
LEDQIQVKEESINALKLEMDLLKEQLPQLEASNALLKE